MQLTWTRRLNLFFLSKKLPSLSIYTITFQRNALKHNLKFEIHPSSKTQNKRKPLKIPWKTIANLLKAAQSASFQIEEEIIRQTALIISLWLCEQERANYCFPTWKVLDKKVTDTFKWFRCVHGILNRQRHHSLTYEIEDGRTHKVYSVFPILRIPFRRKEWSEITIKWI